VTSDVQNFASPLLNLSVHCELPHPSAASDVILLVYTYSIGFVNGM